MTPIESIYDVRLVVLLETMIEMIEALAIETDCNPEQILSDHLFLSTKKVHEYGEEVTMAKLQDHYPMLSEALD